MEIIKSLEASKQKTLLYFDLSEEELNKSYDEGKWTVRELLHHITDAETVLYDRLRRVISEPRQVIWAFDQEAWSEHLQYKKMPLDLNRKIFESVRDGIIYLAQEHYEINGDKEFIHSGMGLRTLRDEFDKVAWHCEGHLEQIDRALSL